MKNLIKQNTKALLVLSHTYRCTRPDIAFAVNQAARKSENPTVSDWNKVVNIMKYLNSTINYKIIINGSLKITAFADSDFASDKNDSKSTSGYIILMGSSPIVWLRKSKKQ